MTTHVSSGSLTAYAGGSLDDVTSWAVEAHLESCPACLARLGDLTQPDLSALLSQAKAGIDAGVRAGPAPVRARRWRRAARRWTAWSLLPLATVTSLAVLAAFVLERLFPDRPSLVLLLAPVAPLTGLALSWSSRRDPSWETVAGTARAGLELLLRRALAVLVAVLPPLAVAGWLLERSPALWLLPSLTFTAATLLLGGLLGVPRAAVLLGSGWLAAVAAPAIAANVSPVLIEPASVPGWALAATLTTLLAVLRSGALRHLDSWK